MEMGQIFEEAAASLRHRCSSDTEAPEGKVQFTASHLGL